MNTPSPQPVKVSLREFLSILLEIATEAPISAGTALLDACLWPIVTLWETDDPLAVLVRPRYYLKEIAALLCFSVLLLSTLWFISGGPLWQWIVAGCIYLSGSWGPVLIVLCIAVISSSTEGN